MAGDDDGSAYTYVGPSRRTEQRSAPAARAVATFDVTYTGFTRRARIAFQAALAQWSTRVSSSVPITVDASFAPAATGNLGYAGSSMVWRDYPEIAQPGTWYVDAVANRLRGFDVDPSPDIVASFNSTRTDWYFGTDGNTPAGRYDFESVVMHEVGHGLGFYGFASFTGTTGSVRHGGYPSSFDRFTRDGAGTALVDLPDGSTQVGDRLRGNALYFDSPRVRSANGGAAARLYAPSSWQPGSSYSHLNEATYRPGNPNSLMTPSLNAAEAIHSPGPIVRAVFASTGW